MIIAALLVLAAAAVLRHGRTSPNQPAPSAHRQTALILSVIITVGCVVGVTALPGERVTSDGVRPITGGQP